MTIHRYQPVYLRTVRRGVCPVCSRKVTRERTTNQTINPYNRNADGSVKTFAEIRSELIAESAEWTPDFTHAKCREEAA